MSEEIWYRVVQIVTNQGDALQKYAAQQVWAALLAERMPHRTLVKVAGYVLGEFGHTIADSPGSSAEDQLRTLHEHFMQAEPDTKALLLSHLMATRAFVAQTTRSVQRSTRQLRITAPPLLEEYSTKVKLQAEAKAPLRQARIFFLYPSVIAGASIASYVSVLRVISGKVENIHAGSTEMPWDCC